MRQTEGKILDRKILSIFPARTPSPVFIEDVPGKSFCIQRGKDDLFIVWRNREFVLIQPTERTVIQLFEYGNTVQVHEALIPVTGAVMEYSGSRVNLYKSGIDAAFLLGNLSFGNMLVRKSEHTKVTKMALALYYGQKVSGDPSLFELALVEKMRNTPRRVEMRSKKPLNLE